MLHPARVQRGVVIARCDRDRGRSERVRDQAPDGQAVPRGTRAARTSRNSGNTIFGDP